MCRRPRGGSSSVAAAVATGGPRPRSGAEAASTAARSACPPAGPGQLPARPPRPRWGEGWLRPPPGVNRRGPGRLPPAAAAAGEVPARPAQRSRPPPGRQRGPAGREVSGLSGVSASVVRSPGTGGGVSGTAGARGCQRPRAWGVSSVLSPRLGLARPLSGLRSSWRVGEKGRCEELAKPSLPSGPRRARAASPRVQNQRSGVF